MSWTPFLAFEGISGNVDRNGLHTIVAPYFVRTLAEARKWLPEDLEATVGVPFKHREYRQEWGNGKLLDAGKDGAYRLELTCEGMENPNEDENGVQFDADYSLSESPSEEHPDIIQLVADYGDFDEDGSPKFENAFIQPEEGDEFKNPLYGFKKYRVPGVIWTKTFLTSRPSPSLGLRLGKIDVPERAPGGYLPSVPDKMKWMLIIAKPEFRNNCWKCTKAWEAGNWPEPVYGR